jgi:antitoxin (DNA-binding transcriptional repressor) of toxin-antitoxin stability system
MRVRYTIGLREANHHLARHIKAVEEGHEVIITRRGRPVARITQDIGNDRTKDPEWRAAYEHMVRLMAEGLPLGGVRLAREEIYERRSRTDP